MCYKAEECMIKDNFFNCTEEKWQITLNKIKLWKYGNFFEYTVCTVYLSLFLIAQIYTLFNIDFD